MIRSYTCPRCKYIFNPGRQFTLREKSILEYLSKGKPTKIIADSLCVSMKTIHSHYSSIKNKLHVNSLREVIVYAVSHSDYNKIEDNK